MSFARRLTISVTLAGALLGACTSGSTPSATQATGAFSTLAPGDPVAQVTLPVLAGGGATGEIFMGDLGGPSVINFWATWCSFCVDEMPDFEAVHAEFGEQVRIIGVDREDFADRARTFADEIGITYELVEDQDGAFFRAAQGRGMPTTLFVDADGIIRYRHAGPMTAVQLRGFLAQYLDIGAA